MKNAFPSRVYVIQASNGLVKIGRSMQPEQRAKALAGASGHSMEICFLTEVRDDSSYVETAAHALLADCRRGGEWFEVHPSVAAAAVREAVKTVARRQDNKRCEGCRPNLLHSPLDGEVGEGEVSENGEPRIRWKKLGFTKPYKLLSLRFSDEGWDSLCEMQSMYTRDGIMPSKADIVRVAVLEKWEEREGPIDGPWGAYLDAWRKKWLPVQSENTHDRHSRPAAKDR